MKPELENGIEFLHAGAKPGEEAVTLFRTWKNGEVVDAQSTHHTRFEVDTEAGTINVMEFEQIGFDDLGLD